MKLFAVACVLLGCVLPAPYARAGGPAMLIGVAEDSVRQPTLAEAKAEMDLLVQAGLAAAYDALKAVSPKLVVLGGAISPHGGDDPDSIRPTHSPTAFLTDLGAAYRASSRTKPIMDGLALHPYEDNSSVAPIDGVH